MNPSRPVTQADLDAPDILAAHHELIEMDHPIGEPVERIRCAAMDFAGLAVVAAFVLVAILI